MTIDSIDAHDGYKPTKGHAGCGVLPALLALLEAQYCAEVSEEELLTGLLIGYEIACRAGASLHDSVCDYHTSGAWVALAAAALGARILQLDAEQTRHALGIAEYHGPRSQMMRVIDHPTMLKDGSGWGAMAGVSAAYLAADGFTGAPAVTVCDPVVDDIWADLGKEWIIFDQYFKPQPVCRWAQPSVEAALSLRETYAIDPTAIERIDITTFHEAARLATAHPATTEHAQYSLPFPVAAALARGQLGATEVTADGLGDPAIDQLADRVFIQEDAAHNAAFPVNRYARVSVELSNGRVLTSEDHEPRGDATAHLDDDEIRAKFHTFAAPVIGDTRAKTIEAAVDGLVDGSSLEPLWDQIIPTA